MRQVRPGEDPRKTNSYEERYQLASAREGNRVHECVAKLALLEHGRPVVETERRVRTELSYLQAVQEEQQDGIDRNKRDDPEDEREND